MALAASDGGFEEVFFVDSVHERFICSVCTLVLRDPHLMLCCGQKYCASCLNSWFKTQRSKSCPHCRADKSEEPILHALDKGMKSEIDSFKIFCFNQASGCKWIGELRSLKKHLHSENGCQYYEIKCPNKCTFKGIILRKDLKKHLTKFCELRRVKCSFCSSILTAKYYPDHKEKYCKFYPVICPKRCGKYVERWRLKEHMITLCPVGIVACSYVHSGCAVKLERRYMKYHVILCDFRQCTCKYCGFMSLAKNRDNHALVCEMHPLSCPNGCGTVPFIRKELGNHLETCPHEVVACKYAYVGCAEKRKREDMPQHLDTSQNNHLELLTVALSVSEKLRKEAVKQFDKNALIVQECTRRTIIQSSPQPGKSALKQIKFSKRSVMRWMLFRVDGYYHLKDKKSQWNSNFFDFESMGIIRAQLCLRVLFSECNKMTLQLYVMNINKPYRMREAIHIRVVYQTKFKVENFSDTITIGNPTWLTRGAAVGKWIIDTNMAWELAFVLENSILLAVAT